MKQANLAFIVAIVVIALLIKIASRGNYADDKQTVSD